MEVLGMTETRGLVALIETSGTMVKAVCVKSAGAKQTGGGLCTAMVRGDVIVYEAVIDVDTAAIQRIDELVSVHVISCPHGDPEEAFPIDLKGGSSNL